MTQYICIVEDKQYVQIYICWAAEARYGRRIRQRGGDGSVQFEGSLEPINWGNFYDMKLASQLFKLVGCATRLRPRLIASDKTNHLCFILPVVLTSAVQKKEGLCTNRWVRREGGWKFGDPLPLKSQMQVTFTHAAAGAEHGKSEVWPKQFTLKENEMKNLSGPSVIVVWLF